MRCMAITSIAEFNNQRHRIQRLGADGRAKDRSSVSTGDAVIPRLKAFNTHNPNNKDPADQITQLGLGGNTSQGSPIKCTAQVAAINPSAPPTAGTA